MEDILSKAKGKKEKDKLKNQAKKKKQVAAKQIIYITSKREDIPTIADQILADTRGYVSKDWKTFLYVIYKTNRFKPENDWIELLRQSGVPENTTVVVLSGEPPAKTKKKILPKKMS